MRGLARSTKAEPARALDAAEPADTELFASVAFPALERKFADLVDPGLHSFILGVKWKRIK